MKARDVLCRKGSRILTVRMDEPVETAARLLRQENVGALVVKDVCGTEGDVIVGMFSERDILRAIVDLGATALQKPVASLMSRDVISCSPDDDLRNLLELMENHHIRHIPVLEDMQLVGVISIRDFISLRLEELSDAEPNSNAL